MAEQKKQEAENKKSELKLLLEGKLYFRSFSLAYVQSHDAPMILYWYITNAYGILMQVRFCVK